jgi:thiol-disulfide isomerase/thioredoxin
MAGLSGKVVVMDFWYRGCGWCMYAMPQIKQLAADYKDKNVIVLGMNTDREIADAKLVVSEFDLTYPQIRAEQIPQLFGVQGFPTTIVIDQKGIVRGIHVGYSPTLHNDVAKQIDELIKR